MSLRAVCPENIQSAKKSIDSRKEQNMTTSGVQGVTRRDLETQLIEKAWKDPDFKTQVVTDPKGVFESHFGHKLPEQFRIFIHEEDANTLHFTIPPAPSNVAELSDEDLEKVAGGTDIAMTILFAVTVAGVSAATAIGTASALNKPPQTW
jgi:hypothetical protein